MKRLLELTLCKILNLHKMTKAGFLLFIWIPFIQTTAAQKQPVDYVNVFTGTSNSRWMLFPGATTPFGMVKLSPDNQENVWNGGYEYTINSISGFSHLHAMSLGGVSVMPVVGNLQLYPGQYKTFPGKPDGPYHTMWTAGYRSRFKKETESGSPGYYRVHLLDYDVLAELTATKRTGWSRFTFPKSEDAHLLFDFNFDKEEKEEIKEVAVTVNGSILSGYIRQNNQYVGDYTVYFVTQLNKTIDSVQSWTREEEKDKTLAYGSRWRGKTTIIPVKDTFRGSGSCGLILNFHTAEKEAVILKTGISFVGEAEAAQNLVAETGDAGFDFDQIAVRARKEWNDLLGTVEAEGADSDKTTFYTCLYRSYSGKSVMNDADGAYRDGCGNVQHLKAPVDAVYSADGAWGTQWNLSPLWTLLSPGVANSWVNHMLELYDKGGWTPEAPTALKYAPIMGAQHHLALMISAYQKNIRHFDVEKAWKAVKHDLTTPGMEAPCGGYAGDRQLTPYLKYGYVPDEDGAASNTLEYAYDDYCAAQFAKSLGKEADYQYFKKRSESYKNLFDPITGFMRRRRRDGSWVAPLDVHAFGTQGGWNGSGFMEGTAWIYSFFVPHDVPALVKMVGKEKFNARLEEGFAKGYVDLGNQPNLQAPFLFNYSGKPWLTQKYTNQVLRTMYDNSPYTGWIGEEDEGQLSALYVLLAMGLFEMDGGCSTEPYYDLSSPIFSKITIHLNKTYYGGGDFIIETERKNPGDIYIQKAMLNGVPLKKAMLPHKELVKGGKLVITLGPAPNERWGSGE